MIYRRGWFAASLLGLSLSVGSIGTAAFAQDEEVDDIPLIDGTIWNASSEVEKESYLVGAGNFLTVEYVFQHQMENPPTNEQTSVTRYWDGLEGTTLNEMVEVIDNWYEANPDGLERPVLVVIWNEYVEKD